VAVYQKQVMCFMPHVQNIPPTKKEAAWTSETLVSYHRWPCLWPKWFKESCIAWCLQHDYSQVMVVMMESIYIHVAFSVPIFKSWCSCSREQ